MNELKRYVWETDETELQELIVAGYDIVYQDINLSVIYELIANCYEDHELKQWIDENFGYYGLSRLLQVDGMHYWIVQV